MTLLRNCPTPQLLIALAGLTAGGFGPKPAPDVLDRFRPERLAAVHQAVLAWRTAWQRLPRRGPYAEVRANIHVHSSLSHDSRGTIEEIVAAARAVGTRLILFTEHPSERFDYFHDGHQGIREGILLIPGAETRGFLVFPTMSLRGLDGGTPQEFADLVRARGGLVFLSHLEERMDWDIHGLTGTEIYNTHANLKSQRALTAALRTPWWLASSLDSVRRYPQEAFSALQEYPAAYLQRWDQLCQQAPLTGIAANDSHQSIGMVVRLLEGNRVQISDALGKTLVELDAALLPVLERERRGKQPGAVLLRVLLDPYENSFRHVGTHLLLRELSTRGAWDALQAGRAFVAFDWLADAGGFDFQAAVGERRFEMGSRIPFVDGIQLSAQAPLPVHWKVFRSGQLWAQANGRSWQASVSRPGIYRVEAWLRVAGEDTVWILSNPVYVQPPEKEPANAPSSG